jgi:hypothetical protein
MLQELRLYTTGLACSFPNITRSDTFIYHGGLRYLRKSPWEVKERQDNMFIKKISIVHEIAPYPIQ